MEIWKSILGYERYYEISNIGRVRGIERFVKHPNGGLLKKNVKYLKPSSNGTGYMRIMFSKDGLRKEYYVHRLIMEAFVGKSSLHINHKNGIRDDNRLENLEYVTIRENQHKRNLNRTLPLGVQKVRNKYRAVIGINGKKVHLGYFDTVEDASFAFKNKLKTINND
jgi:hypothetical protein